jgi:uncharacterized protein (DUF58 family)
MSSKPSNPTQANLTELIGLNRAASSLKLHAARIRSRQSGQYLSRIKGRGMEFDESRPYEPGDDVRNIDWRVTARTGKTHTKMFREERERPVFISIDSRASMFFASHGRFKSVIAAELASLVAWTAHQQGDRIGGEIYSESDHSEFRPRRGQHNVLRILKQLSTQTLSPAAGDVSLEAPFRRLSRIAHPGSLICVISDFRGLNEAASRELINLSRHSDLLLLHVYDLLETRLPDKGYYQLSFAGRTLNFNASNQTYRQRYLLHFEQRMQQLEQLSDRHINLLHCRTDDSPLEVLRQRFGSSKTRQRLVV